MNPQQALIVALELLRVQVTELSTVIIENNDLTEEQLTERSKGGGKGSGGNAETPGVAGRAVQSVVGMATSVATKLGAIVGPAALLSQALAAPISGLQTLSTAAKLLGSTFSPVLLPAVLLLSAGMVALSEIVHDEMMESFDELATFILDTGIPALVRMIEAVQDFTRWVDEHAGGTFGGIGRGATLEDFKKLLTGDFEGIGVRGAAAGAVEGERSASRITAERRVESGLRDSLASLRRSLGPSASIGSLESVGRNAQLAALNADPLEARLLRQQIQVLERIERALNRRAGKDRPVYPAGGGEVGGDF